MDWVVRYVVATALALVGGYLGYSFLPYGAFGVVANAAFVAGLFGFLAGLGRVTGFLGNVVNLFLLSPFVYFFDALAGFGWLSVAWFGGNAGYAVFNVLGQISRLSALPEARFTAL